MTNRGITILKNNDIYSHQIFIKKGLLMKRENNADIPYRTPPMMIFSFGR